MRHLVLIAAFALGFGSSSASAEQIRLTTLEWPPYVKEDGSGTSPDAVISTFGKAGIMAEVKVFPWNRAVRLAAGSPEWVGVFPEYYSAEIDAEKGGDRCLFSRSFGSSPVGFLVRSGSNFDWSSHDDLTAFVIGVVRGYVNEEKLDDMIANGKIMNNLAEDDAGNILQVAAQRADAIVIDKNVFSYLKEHDPRVAEVSGDLVFHDNLLIEHGLHVCFENTKTGRRARDLFNSHLELRTDTHVAN